MIRDLVVLRSVVAHYKNNSPGASNGPSIKIYMDGDLKKEITDTPSQDLYKTRTFTAPDGVVGYIPHVTTNSTFNTDLQINAEPVSGYSEQILWHYYEVTFRGTVNVSLYLDGELIRGDGDGLDTTYEQVTLTTTKEIETAKAYLSPLAYGRLPHVVNDSDDTGNIVKWRPVALSARFYTGLRAATEGQITYRGDCVVCFYFDGKKIGDNYVFKGSTNKYGNDIYSTERFYLDENHGGRIFQYEQVSGDGDIISVETDAHPLDYEPVAEDEA